VESVHDKRARLRAELQEAYRRWLTVSDPAHWDRDGAGLDADGRDASIKPAWFAYLAAKSRLVQARAEPAPAV
jgi:hypothetical protein